MTGVTYREEEKHEVRIIDAQMNDSMRSSLPGFDFNEENNQGDRYETYRENDDEMDISGNAWMRAA